MSAHSPHHYLIPRSPLPNRATTNFSHLFHLRYFPSASPPPSPAHHSPLVVVVGVIAVVAVFVLCCLPLPLSSSFFSPTYEWLRRFSSVARCSASFAFWDGESCVDAYGSCCDEGDWGTLFAGDCGTRVEGDGGTRTDGESGGRPPPPPPPAATGDDGDSGGRLDGDSTLPAELADGTAASGAAAPAAARSSDFWFADAPFFGDGLHEPPPFFGESPMRSMCASSSASVIACTPPFSFSSAFFAGFASSSLYIFCTAVTVAAAAAMALGVTGGDAWAAAAAAMAAVAAMAAGCCCWAAMWSCWRWKARFASFGLPALLLLPMLLTLVGENIAWPTGTLCMLYICWSLLKKESTFGTPERIIEGLASLPASMSCCLRSAAPAALSIGDRRSGGR
eukprot:Rhum_TRINITY_DN15375_c6_g1::Rhum_TRINITY_DN15375_c6_g1_i1::g.154582::m.154582